MAQLTNYLKQIYGLSKMYINCKEN